MPTYGQASFFRSNINAFIGLTLVGSFSLWMGLLIWQAGVGNNPIADAMANAMYPSAQAQGLLDQ